MRQESDGLYGLPGFMLRITARSFLKLSALGVLFVLMAFFLSGMLLLGEWAGKAATVAAGRLGADLMVLPAQIEIPSGDPLVGTLPGRFSLPEGIESSVAELPGISQVAPRYFLASAQAACCDAGNLLLVGFDPSRDFTLRPWLKNQKRDYLAGNDILAGSGVMKWQGAEIRLYNRTFRVVAKLEKSGMEYLDNAIYIPLEGLAAMARSSSSAVPLEISWERPSMLLAKLSPGADAKQAAALLEQKFPGVRAVTMPSALQDKRARMTSLAAYMNYLTVAAWLLVMAAGGAVQLLFWKERKPVMGLLQMWGWSRGHLLVFFGLEALLLSLPGIIAGSAASLFLYSHFSSSLAFVTGLPILPVYGSMTFSGALRAGMAFAGAMAVEALIILLFFTRREPAELMRGA